MSLPVDQWLAHVLYVHMVPDSIPAEACTTQDTTIQNWEVTETAVAPSG